MSFITNILWVLIYFAPTIVAWKWDASKTKPAWVVFLVNLTLGWTVIGWFIAWGMVLIDWRKMLIERYGRRPAGVSWNVRALGNRATNLRRVRRRPGAALSAVPRLARHLDPTDHRARHRAVAGLRLLHPGGDGDVRQLRRDRRRQLLTRAHGAVSALNRAGGGARGWPVRRELEVSLAGFREVDEQVGLASFR